jgi:hypothetical protein
MLHCGSLYEWMDYLWIMTQMADDTTDDTIWFYIILRLEEDILLVFVLMESPYTRK